MFEFDTGGGGVEGPFISWSARGTQDGTISPKSFFLRTTEGKSPLDAFDKGVVLDIANMKTGWQKSEGIVGQAPEWKWNPSVAHMAPQPSEDWKKGIHIRCAIGGGQTAIWEQAGVAAWDAFAKLVPALQQGPGDGSLPMVRMTGVEVMQFKRGSTAAPRLEVIKWVPRPDCLKEQASIATEPQQPAQPKPAPAQAVAQPAQAPADALTDDDLDF